MSSALLFSFPGCHGRGVSVHVTCPLPQHVSHSCCPPSVGERVHRRGRMQIDTTSSTVTFFNSLLFISAGHFSRSDEAAKDDSSRIRQTYLSTAGCPRALPLCSHNKSDRRLLRENGTRRKNAGAWVPPQTSLSFLPSAAGPPSALSTVATRLSPLLSQRHGQSLRALPSISRANTPSNLLLLPPVRLSEISCGHPPPLPVF